VKILYESKAAGMPSATLKNWGLKNLLPPATKIKIPIYSAKMTPDEIGIKRLNC
jgi:hypothetical protein